MSVTVSDTDGNVYRCPMCGNTDLAVTYNDRVGEVRAVNYVERPNGEVVVAYVPD